MNQYEQGSQEWLDARKGRFTSSEIYRLMTDPRTKAAKEAGELSEGAKTYCFEKACAMAFGWEQPFDGNAATEHGNEWEPVALKHYEDMQEFTTVERTGFIPYGDNTGGSLDAIEDGKRIIEVKCPHNQLNFYKFVADGEYPKQYYYQMQHLMAITGTKEARLVYFLPDLVAQAKSPIYWLDVQIDEELVADMMQRIERAAKYRDEVIEDLNNKLGRV